MRRLTNIQLDGITFEVNKSLPISERSSLFVHFLTLDHFLRNETKAVNLSYGNLNDMVLESISSPRNVRAVNRPMVFLGAKGTPRSLNMDIVVSISSLHWGKDGGPAKKKSSK